MKMEVKMDYNIEDGVKGSLKDKAIYVLKRAEKYPISTELPYDVVEYLLEILKSK